MSYQYCPYDFDFNSWNGNRDISDYNADWKNKGGNSPAGVYPLRFVDIPICQDPILLPLGSPWYSDVINQMSTTVFSIIPTPYPENERKYKGVTQIKPEDINFLQWMNDMEGTWDITFIPTYIYGWNDKVIADEAKDGKFIQITKDPIKHLRAAYIGLFASIGEDALYCLSHSPESDAEYFLGGLVGKDTWTTPDLDKELNQIEALHIEEIRRLSTLYWYSTYLSAQGDTTIEPDTGHTDPPPLVTREITAEIRDENDNIIDTNRNDAYILPRKDGSRIIFAQGEIIPTTLTRRYIVREDGMDKTYWIQGGDIVHSGKSASGRIVYGGGGEKFYPGDSLPVSCSKVYGSLISVLPPVTAIFGQTALSSSSNGVMSCLSWNPIHGYFGVGVTIFLAGGGWGTTCEVLMNSGERLILYDIVTNNGEIDVPYVTIAKISVSISVPNGYVSFSVNGQSVPGNVGAGGTPCSVRVVLG